MSILFLMLYLIFEMFKLYMIPNYRPLYAEFKVKYKSWLAFHSMKQIIKVELELISDPEVSEFFYTGLNVFH